MPRIRWRAPAVPPSSPPITDPATSPGPAPGGFGRLVRRTFWAIQAIAGLGVAMMLAGLLIEDIAPGSPLLGLLAAPIGLLPVLGPVWAVATPLLAVLMLLTRNRHPRATDA